MSTPRPGRIQQAYRGERLGLPPDGRGSIASTPARIAAFVLDAVASAVVAGLVVALTHPSTAADHLPRWWSLVALAIDYLVGMLVFGRTLGMYPIGLRIVRVDRDVAVNPVQALVRTALLILFIPAVIFDRDGRGMHDRFTDTAVVRG